MTFQGPFQLEQPCDAMIPAQEIKQSGGRAKGRQRAALPASPSLWQPSRPASGAPALLLSAARKPSQGMSLEAAMPSASSSPPL